MPIPSTSALIPLWKDPGRGCQCITQAPELGVRKASSLLPLTTPLPPLIQPSLQLGPPPQEASPGGLPPRPPAASTPRSLSPMGGLSCAGAPGLELRSVRGSMVLPEPGLLSFPGPVRIQQLASLPLLLPRPRRGPMRSCSHLSLDECYGLSSPKMLSPSLQSLGM